MSDTLRGVLSHLISLVPGYTGYAELEKRRESDHALRLAEYEVNKAVRAMPLMHADH